MAFDNYLPLTKVVLPMNENETVAKPETKKQQSTWGLLFDCKVFIAGQLSVARHELENAGSDYLREIFRDRVAEDENLITEINEKMKNLDLICK